MENQNLLEILVGRQPISLSIAMESANYVIRKIGHFCERIEIAGSVRRKKDMVKDLEIVCIPTSEKEIDLFGDEVWVPCTGFIKTVNQWLKVKGEPTGRYTQRILPDNNVLDLFIANKDNWGYIYAIRTGSAEYSHHVLAKGWVKNGYTGKEGALWKDGKAVIIPEEIDLFKICGVDWIEPEEREFDNGEKEKI
jgi:DNA polymerase/3'-5' exonuclease PolX